MYRLLISVVMLLVFTTSMAAVRKPIGDVNIDAFTKDTQTSPKGAGDRHVSLIWWVPNEFWESILARDTTTSGPDKQAMINAMSGVSLMAVVQADISTLGGFDFYTKGDVEKNMKISFSGTGGNTVTLKPINDISPDLNVVLAIFKPILAAAMGNMGANLHFYVLNDKGERNTRVLDPYKKGTLNVQLAKKDKQRMTASLQLPLNSLFVPRKCPNGEDAHISWNYCPWSGKQLDN